MHIAGRRADDVGTAPFDAAEAVRAARAERDAELMARFTSEADTPRRRA